LWTRRRGGFAEDEARAVAFAADGTVYVAGRAKSTMPGATAGVGGWDGYLQGFRGSDGAAQATVQFGSTGDDGAVALAVSGNSVVVAGTETGRAVVRSFIADAAGALTAAATRDLGDLQGGSVAGVGFDGAEVVVAGSTFAGGLSAGTVTTAYQGGRDGFIARLQGSLAADAGDRLTYLGGAGDDQVSAMAIRNGSVYIAGASDGAMASTTAPLGARDGFLMRLDSETGAVGWSRRFTGKDGEVAPTSIAIAAGGASVLDRLGLPKGTIDYTGAKSVVSASSVRAGDQFFVSTREGVRGKAVTIAADDTLKTLAVKINRALGFNARAEVVRDGPFDRLQIKPRDARTLVEITPGKGGKDALAPLGLTEGVVRFSAPGAKAGSAAVDGERKAYGLQLGRDLRLDEPEQIKHALAELATAMVSIRTAFRGLRTANDPAPPAAKITGEAPAYLKGQLANYQAALQRLGG
jgi:hypothetical protein